MSCYVTELRPLLLAMRVLGWFPLRAQHDGSGLELRFSSLIFTYSAFVVVAQLVLWVTLTTHAFEMIPLLDPSLQLLAFCYMFSLTLPLALSPMAALQSKSHLALCNGWDNFQSRFERVTHQRLLLGLRGLSVACLATCSLYSTVMPVQRVVVQGRPPTPADLVFSLSVVISVVLVLWWFFACRALALASTCLLQQYKTLRGLRDARGLALSFQPLWLQLRSLLVLTGAAMSASQGALLAYNLGLVLTCSYQTIMWDTPVTKGFFAFFGTVALTAFAVACHSGHAANTTVYQNILEAIEITKSLNMSIRTQHEVLSFLSSVARNLPCISWSGYLRVDRGLLTSSLAAVFTSLVVLVQLGIRQTATFTLTEMFAFSEQLTRF